MRKLFLLSIVLGFCSLGLFGQAKKIKIEKRSVTMYVTFTQGNGVNTKRVVPFFDEAEIKFNSSGNIRLLKANVAVPEGKGFWSYNEELSGSIAGKKVIIKIKKDTPVEVSKGELVIKGGMDLKYLN